MSGWWNNLWKAKLFADGLNVTHQTTEGSFAFAGGIKVGTVQQAVSYTLSAAANGTNVNLTAVTQVDGLGEANASPFLLWLTTGNIAAATTASGAVTATTTGGVACYDVINLDEGTARLCQPNASGVYNLSITDSSKTLYTINVMSPAGYGKTSVTLTAGEYGS